MYKYIYIYIYIYIYRGIYIYIYILACSRRYPSTTKCRDNDVQVRIGSCCGSSNEASFALEAVV